MKEEAKPRRAFAAIGVPTLATVLMVLLLCSFAALSLLSALADQRWTQRTAQAQKEYYQADALATERLEELDGWLERGDTAAIEAAGIVLDEDTARFSVPVNSKMKLVVEVRVRQTGVSDILTWRTETEE